MSERALLASVVCSSVLLTACIDSTTRVSVRPDGSGLVTETQYLNERAMAMARGLVAKMAGREADPQARHADRPPDVEEYKRRARGMGTGVTLVSATPVTSPDGSAGVEAVYAFQDVRRLALSVMPDNPLRTELAGTLDVTTAKDDTPVTFDFKRGPTPRLIVNMPRRPSSGRSDERPAADDPGSRTGAAGTTFMKPFLQGFRIRLMIEPLVGRLADTNAAFVERRAGSDSVTLFDIDIGKIAGNDQFLQEFQDLDSIKDPSVALEKMKTIPGLKIEPAERVEISFKPERR